MPIWLIALICIGCSMFGAIVTYFAVMAYISKGFRR
jgi:hypothetical protein